jgi:hypothetical protein
MLLAPKLVFKVRSRGPADSRRAARRPVLNSRAQHLLQFLLDGELDGVLNPLPHQDFQRV